MKTAEELRDHARLFLMNSNVYDSQKTIPQVMAEFATHYAPKWIPFEEWSKDKDNLNIHVDTYSKIWGRVPECFFDGESICINEYDYYPGETEIWIMNIPEKPESI